MCLCFVPRHLLDNCIFRCCLSWQMSRHLYLSRFTKPLYIGSVRFGFHFFRSLSLDSFVSLPPKSLSLTPNLFPKCFSRFFKVFSSLGMFLIFHLHAFHVLKPRLWGFSKLMSYYWNFGMSFCLNEFKISCIVSHKHYNSIIMHLDVCKLIVC